MNDTLKVQAVKFGVPLKRLEVLREVGIAFEDRGRVERFGDKELRKITKIIDASELMRVINRPSMGIMLDEYLDLRKVISEVDIDGLLLKDYSLRDVLAGLNGNLTLSEILTAKALGLHASDVAAATRIGIGWDDLVAVKSLTAYLGYYLDMRDAGYSHDELMDILRINAKIQKLSFEHYRKLRELGTPHDDVMHVLNKTESEESGSMSYYYDYRTDERNPLSHDEAAEATVARIYPHHYYRARHLAPHEQIVEAKKAGVSIEKYAEFRNDNCRITHDEIVQYAKVSGRYDQYGINSYIILLDRGVTFETIIALTSKGLSLYDIKRLSGDEFKLDDTDLHDVAAASLSANQYAALRQSGMTHHAVITAALSVPSNESSD